MPEVIDLRSDTVTRPSPEMRRVMAEAEVGDDVYEDDPTVNRLQEVSAARLGKEAALFLPSGTMSNAVAIMCHTHPGHEILLDGDAHSMLYELGLPGAVCGVLARQFSSVAGVPDVSALPSLIHKETLHSPRTALIVLENTHNRAGGAIIPLSVHEEIWQLACNLDLRVHLDGARLFNAAVATGLDARVYASYADSVTFCLSKGLGCPVGSVLCGTQRFIAKARRARKMLGGGMRQIGVLAAAGLYALENNIQRLQIDHANARRLAEGLRGASGLTLDTSPPTNMLYVTTDRPAAEVCADLKARHGVLCSSFGDHLVRFVTHMDINQSDIDRAVHAICSVA